MNTFKRSNDPDYEVKKNRILHLYNRTDGKIDKQRGDPDVVMCFDEFGPLNLQPHPGKQWAVRGGGADQPRRPSGAVNSGRYSAAPNAGLVTGLCGVRLGPQCGAAGSISVGLSCADIGFTSVTLRTVARARISRLVDRFVRRVVCRRVRRHPEWHLSAVRPFRPVRCCSVWPGTLVSCHLTSAHGRQPAR